jgi:hypothetical protein
MTPWVKEMTRHPVRDKVLFNELLNFGRNWIAIQKMEAK